MNRLLLIVSLVAGLFVPERSLSFAAEDRPTPPPPGLVPPEPVVGPGPRAEPEALARRRAEIQARIEESRALAQAAERARVIDVMVEFGLKPEEADAIYAKRETLLGRIRAAQSFGRLPIPDIERYDKDLRASLGDAQHQLYRKFEQSKPFWEEAAAIVASVSSLEAAERAAQVRAVAALLQKEKLITSVLETPYRFIQGTPENEVAVETVEQHTGRIVAFAESIERQDAWKKLPPEILTAASAYFKRAADNLKWRAELAKMTPAEQMEATRKRAEERRRMIEVEMRERAAGQPAQPIPKPALPDLF